MENNIGTQNPTPQQQAPQVFVNIPSAPARKNNGMGVAGFVLAIVALVFCWVPILCWILWILGLIFSFIGVFKAPRGLAIAGLVISLIDFIVLIFMLGAFAAALAV